MPHRAPNLPSSSSPPKGIRSLPHFTVCPFRCNDDGLAHRANATTFGDKTSSRRISFVVIECWRENFSKKRVDLRRQLWRHSRSFPQVKGKFLCERSSVVELHLAKVNVEGSNPFARSILKPVCFGRPVFFFFPKRLRRSHKTKKKTVAHTMKTAHICVPP